MLPEITFQIYYFIQILVMKSGFEESQANRKSIPQTFKTSLICQFIKQRLFAKHCSRSWKCSNELNSQRDSSPVGIPCFSHFFFSFSWHTWSFLKLHIKFEQPVSLFLHKAENMMPYRNKINFCFSFSELLPKTPNNGTVLLLLPLLKCWREVEKLMMVFNSPNMLQHQTSALNPSLVLHS